MYAVVKNRPELVVFARLRLRHLEALQNWLSWTGTARHLKALQNWLSWTGT